MSERDTADPAYSAAFAFRIEDLVIPATETPIWDALVTEFGDPIPGRPAPSWPATPDQKVTDDAPTASRTDQ